MTGAAPKAATRRQTWVVGQGRDERQAATAGQDTERRDARHGARSDEADKNKKK